MTHKEKGKNRIVCDGKDRRGIHEKLDICIDPLDPEQHPEGLVKVVTGIVASSEVNVNNALAIGMKQKNDFEGNWPESFHKTISKKVRTMAMEKKDITIDGQGDLDQNNLLKDNRNRAKFTGYRHY